MRLGANEQGGGGEHPHRLPGPGSGLGIGGVPRGRIIEIYGPESSGQNHPGLHIAAGSPEAGARWPSSTPSTPWTPPMPGPWGWILTTCSSPSRTPGSRAWRSARPRCAPAPWTSSWWTPWPPHPRAEIEGEMGTPTGLLARLMSQAPAEAGRLHRQDPLRGDFHQPAPGKGGGHVRQP